MHSVQRLSPFKYLSFLQTLQVQSSSHWSQPTMQLEQVAPNFNSPFSLQRTHKFVVVFKYQSVWHTRQIESVLHILQLSIHFLQTFPSLNIPRILGLELASKVQSRQADLSVLGKKPVAQFPQLYFVIQD